MQNEFDSTPKLNLENLPNGQYSINGEQLSIGKPESDRQRFVEIKINFQKLGWMSHADISWLIAKLEEKI